MLPFPFTPHKIDDFFGTVRSYGLHNGIDLNGPLGGNTDCGTLLYPVAKGKCVYAQKLNKNFGNLIVYEVSGTWGTRWVGYAHCQEFLIGEGDTVSPDDPIAKLGTTGFSSACHLHMFVFTTRPPRDNWRTGVRSKSTLGKYYEAPLLFIKDNSVIISPPIMDIRLKLLEDYRSNDPEYGFANGIKTEGDVREVLGKLNDLSVIRKDKQNLEEEHTSLIKQVKGFINRQVTTLLLPKKPGDEEYTLDDMAAQIIRLIEEEDERDKLLELWERVVGKRDNFENQIANIENWIDDYGNSRPALLERLSQQKQKIEELENEITALRKRKPTRVVRIGSWLIWAVRVENIK